MRKPIRALLFMSGCALAILGYATAVEAAIYRVNFSGTETGGTRKFSGYFDYTQACIGSNGTFNFSGPTGYTRTLYYVIQGSTAAGPTSGVQTDNFIVQLSQASPGAAVLFQLVGTCPTGVAGGSRVHINSTTQATSIASLPPATSFPSAPTDATFNVTNGDGTQTFFKGAITRFSNSVLGYAPGEVIYVQVLATNCQTSPQYACRTRQACCLTQILRKRPRG